MSEHKKRLSDITGVVVSYRTKGLLADSLASVRKFYPELPIILVDGSPPGDSCRKFVQDLEDPYISRFLFEENIGHGRGMHFAIQKVTTPYVLLFDSDIKVRKPVLKDMLELMNETVYGVGMFENVCKDGYFRRANVGGIRIDYLHPFFMLLNRKRYFEFPRFGHHGSPCISAMLEIYNQRLSRTILKEFPVKSYVTHFGRGTRKLSPKDFKLGWDYPSQFLTIITRKHPKRPECYRNHVDSLLRQTCRDFEHLVISDTIGGGVPAANRALHREKARVFGEYVFVLDDDNYLIDDDFVSDIKAIAKVHNPDVIMIRNQIPSRKVPDEYKTFPSPESWKKPPAFSHIDMANFIVKKHVYQAYSQYFCVDRGADYQFIRKVYEDRPKIYWKDRIYSRAMMVGQGKQETSYKDPPAKIAVPKKKGKLSIITCTGDRPEAFRLCQKWVARQTIDYHQWIVVDDGKEPLREIPMGCSYIRRVPQSNDPPHTLCLNMREAFNYVKHEKVVIIEDDDWYSSNYLYIMSSLLDNYHMVGVGSLIFYHVQLPGYSVRKTSRQPALYQTAFRSDVIPFIRHVCQNFYKHKELIQKGLLDLNIWNTGGYTLNPEVMEVKHPMDSPQGRLMPKAKFYPPFPEFILNGIKIGKVGPAKDPLKKYVYKPDTPIAVGMKGLPGRKGLTQAQKIGQNFYKHDKQYLFLKSLIGEDVEYYRGFYHDQGK